MQQQQQQQQQPFPSPCSLPREVSPYTSSVLTLMKRLMVPVMRAASSITCVPYVLFMVNARLLPKLLSTCVYGSSGGSSNSGSSSGKCGTVKHTQ
jgi:hypothetical protein